MWPRLVLAALLNVGGWMVLMGLALLWLPASEAALIAYTMPVWASLLAWPILGERPKLLRVVSLVMAFAGLAAIMGGNGVAASVAKLPGIVMALGGAIGFAVGTVLAKKQPMPLPPITAAAWQIGLGCLPVAIAGLVIETTNLAAVTGSAGCCSIRPWSSSASPMSAGLQRSRGCRPRLRRSAPWRCR